MTKNTKYEENPLMRLTEDLLHEILFRLPTKTLGKCKLVSKEWNSLISDPNFAISHHDHSTKTKLPLTLASQKENYFSVLQFEDYLDITQGVYLALLHEQIPASDYEDYYCFLIGSCHGLVCLYLMCKKTSYGYMEDLMLIWNPVTNECEQIPLPNERGKSKIFLREDSCWFGYLGSIDDYKIVLVYFLGKPVFEDCMFVYSFRTSEWKKICHRAEWDMPFEEGCNSVFMDEALYYLSWYDWICKFDLVAETFERFPFLINEPELIDKSRQILMGFIREENSLCVMFVQHPAEQEQGYAVEIWILQEYNKWDSWKKVYNLRFQPGTVRNSIKAFRFLHNGIVCIQTGNGLGLFDPNADLLPYAIVRDPSCAKVYKVTDYVESLISPFDLP